MGPMRLETLSLVAAMARRILSTTAEAYRAGLDVGAHTGRWQSMHEPWLSWWLTSGGCRQGQEGCNSLSSMRGRSGALLCTCSDHGWRRPRAAIAGVF